MNVSRRMERLGTSPPRPPESWIRASAAFAAGNCPLSFALMAAETAEASLFSIADCSRLTSTDVR